MTTTATLDATCRRALAITEAEAVVLRQLEHEPHGLPIGLWTDVEAETLLSLAARALVTLVGREGRYARVRYWEITDAGRAALEAHDEASVTVEARRLPQGLMYPAQELSGGECAGYTYATRLIPSWAIVVQLTDSETGAVEEWTVMVPAIAQALARARRAHEGGE